MKESILFTRETEQLPISENSVDFYPYGKRPRKPRHTWGDEPARVVRGAPMDASLQQKGYTG